MQTLVACAISIDDVRDIFGAAPGLANRLREAAAARFAAPAPRRSRWFGPVLKRDPDLRVDPSAPSKDDVANLLTGAFVPPDRVAGSWTLLISWLDELSVAVERIAWDPARADDMEFDLSRAGLNSDYALRNLAERDLGISLRPLPGQIAGYAKHVQARETLEALTAIRGADEVRQWLPVLDPLLTVLRAAADRGTDVVVVSCP